MSEFTLREVAKQNIDVYEHIADKYARYHFDDPVLQRARKGFSILLQEHQASTVLDIGCGPGAEVQFFGSEGFRVIGVDGSQQMLEIARSRVPDGDLRRMPLDRLNFEDRTFDGLWSSRTIIHVPRADVQRVLEEWARVLKPNGLLAISVLTGEGEGWITEPYDPEHQIFYHYFEKNELEEALVRAGFYPLAAVLEQDERDGSDNLFVFAQKCASLDLTDGVVQYRQVMEQIFAAEQRLKEGTAIGHSMDELKRLHLQAIRLLPILALNGARWDLVHTNICVHYDRLGAEVDSDNRHMHCQALRLHLPIPSQDVIEGCLGERALREIERIEMVEPDKFYVSQVRTEDARVLFRLGALHLRISQFEKAGLCFKLAHDLGSPDLSALRKLGYNFAEKSASVLLRDMQRIETLLRLGYAMEGQERFDEAIAAAEEAREIAEREEYKKVVPQGRLAEVYHALGHFYTGRSHIGRERPNKQDERQGESYMRKACSIDRAYLSCLGSILSETKRYREAVEVISRALEDPAIRQHPQAEYLCNELYFYRAEAYMGLEDYEEARRDLRVVKAYARNMGDRDSLGHVILYEIRLHLKERSLEQIGLDELRAWVRALEGTRPSLYVVRSFRKDRAQLLEVLRALVDLKAFLEGEEEEEPEQLIEGIVATLRTSLGIKKLRGLAVLTNVPDELKCRMKKSAPDTEASIYDLNIYDLKAIDRSALGEKPVWLIALLIDGISAESIALLSRDVGRAEQNINNTIVICDQMGAIPFSGDVNTSSLEDALLIARFHLAYEEAKRYFGNPKTPLGMAPIGRAPSLLATQAERVLFFAWNELHEQQQTNALA